MGVVSSIRAGFSNRGVRTWIAVALSVGYGLAAGSGQEIAETGILYYWSWQGDYLFGRHIGKHIRGVQVVARSRGTIQLPDVGLAMDYVLSEGGLRFVQMADYGESTRSDKSVEANIRLFLGEDARTARRNQFQFILREPSANELAPKRRQPSDLNEFSSLILNEVERATASREGPFWIGCYVESDPLRFVWRRHLDLDHGGLYVFARKDQEPWSVFELIKIRAHSSRSDDVSRALSRIRGCNYEIR